jgi:hypothetical protein
MHIRIITYLGEPDRLDEGVAYTRDEAQPEVDRLPGSLGLSMWVERESGRSRIATGWVDRAALDGSEAVLSTGVRVQAGKHLGADPSSEVFTVAALHRQGPVEPGHWTRTSRYDLAPSDVDRAVDWFQRQVLPIVREFSGLSAAVLLADGERGKLLSAVTFASRDAMRASGDLARGLRERAPQEVPTVRLTDMSEMELVIAGLRPSEPTT